jgi:hypothetical protein
MSSQRLAAYVATVFTLCSIGVARCDEHPPAYVDRALQQAVAGPLIVSEFLLGTASLNEATARHALIAHVAQWLTEEFSLPLVTAEPSIEFASSERIFALRYGGLRVASAQDASPSPPGIPDARSTVAVYVGSTIYLPEDWTGRTPADLSVLVHEMVHHIQNVGNIRDECPRAREKPAYAAQQRFLQLYERDLESEFDINPFTVLVNSICGY